MRSYVFDCLRDGWELDSFLHRLSEKEKGQLDDLPPERRREKLAGRFLLHRAAREVGLTRISLGKGKYGKPFLRNRGGIPFYFNLSHSGDLVVLVADSSPVGVDVERVREIDLSVTRKFATQTERDWIESGGDPQKRLERFFLLWTLKEAYIKAEGKGFSLSMKSITFTLTQRGEETYTVTSNRPRWCFTAELTKDGYALATAARAKRSMEKERDPHA